MTIDHYGFRNTVRGWLAALALACLSLNAAAYRGDKGLDLLFNQQGNRAVGSLASGGANALAYSSPSATAVGVGSSKSLPWPGKSQALNMAKWKAAAEKGNIAKAIARPTFPLATLASLGLGVLLDEACVRVFGGTMDITGSSQWEECRFGEPITWVTYKANAYGAPNNTAPQQTRADACRVYVQAAYAWAGGRWAYLAASNSCYISPATGYDGIITSEPPSYHGQTSVDPSGSTTVPNQTGWDPISTDAAEAKLATKIGEWTQADFTAGRVENDPAAKAQKLVKELLDKGAAVEVSAQPVVTGPASVQGESKVEKKTEVKPGSAPPTTREVTTTTTNTYNYTYTDNTVNQTTVSTVTNTYSDGDPATTEETETKDERTQCEKDPSTFGCEDLDVPDTEVPKSTKNLDFSPDSLGFGGGSCPAPFGWSDRLGSHTVDLTPYCNMISNIVKPLVLLIAALMALSIVVPGMRSEVGE